ncbi:MAG: hypothetical protein MR964_00325 [Campylobacter sp.]|uniref:hypothetical protein n=1 Tax=Campylobacter sp. TaxID=205 RepID=UPI002AA8520C|nr:hypothetical protein [Campylobacter sp.]MCI7022669.1 hypothetical protein [Campylobacter sp.]
MLEKSARKILNHCRERLSTASLRCAFLLCNPLGATLNAQSWSLVLTAATAKFKQQREFGNSRIPYKKSRIPRKYPRTPKKI